MSAPDYNWPNYVTGPAAHLHALGVIALNYSVYEHSLSVLFWRFLPFEFAEHIFDKLSNQERAGAIRELFRNDAAGVADEIEFMLSHFSTCSENRHILMHSRQADDANASGLLSIKKSARGDPSRQLVFKLTLGQLRRAADEMDAGVRYVLALHDYLETVRPTMKAGVQPQATALPKRPPRPRKIDPHPPHSTPQGETIPQRSYPE